MGLIRSGGGTDGSLWPHGNWRGLYEGATRTDGTLSTAAISWPGVEASAYLGATPRFADYQWMGSLLTEHADQSGLLYRRKRYYDPAKGQFTQPDPIGLAGGLNSYGYGNGDPVSYTDPFGLCTEADGWKDCARMITSDESIAILVAAIKSGEWSYTQGGAKLGVEAAVSITSDFSKSFGDCTDLTFTATKAALGDSWSSRYPHDKPGTGNFHNGTAKGYTRVENSAARAGDIVVTGGHAGIYFGTDSKGNVWGWANNGTPATPTKANHDGGTGYYNFSKSAKNKPEFYRPIK